MKKRLVSLVLSVAMMISVSGVAVAAEDVSVLDANDQEAPFEVVGVLTADDGTEFPVMGTIVPTASSYSMSHDSNEQSVTYKFTVLDPALVDAEYSLHGDGSVTETEYDYYGLGEVSLTIHYLTRDCTQPGVIDGIKEYLLTDISGNWMGYNDTVTMPYGTLNYICSWNGYTEYQKVSGLRVYNNFNVATNFTEYAFSPTANISAELTVRIRNSSRSWELSVKAYING